MKIFKKIFLTKLICASLLFGISSCSLDEVFYREVVPDTFFTSKEAVLAFKSRPFTHFRWFLEHDRWRLQEHTADHFVVPTRGPAGHWFDGGSFQRLHYHTWTVDQGHIWEAWRGGTMGIALGLQTMEILQESVNYEAVGLTQTDRESHLAEIQVLIAYTYMRLLDFFGGMPIFTATTQENTPRSTDRETFDHIEALLLESIPKLPMKPELGSPETGTVYRAAAAMALLQLYFNAEAYIGEARWDQAEKLAEDIISGVYGPYDLDNTWYGIHGFTNDRSPEMVWCTPSEYQRLQYRWFHDDFYHYNSRDYFDLSGSGTGGNNGVMLQPSRDVLTVTKLGEDANGHPIWSTGERYIDQYLAGTGGFRLGSPFEKFHDEDLRKKPFLYLGGWTDENSVPHPQGAYRGMFMVGKQTNPRTGRSSMTNQELAGRILDLVDYVGRLNVPIVGTPLESRMAFAEENSGIRLVKVPQPNTAQITIRFNADNPFMRLAEVYYTLAEIKYRKGDKQAAANLFNTVRKRAFLNNADPDPVTVDNIDSFRILDEWGIEFLGEGRRRTDLIRWNKFVTQPWWDKIPEPTKKHLHRFPIPGRAIAGSNILEQNPGYN